MKNKKKIELNIVIPIAKIDLNFDYEFGKFKYLSKIGNNTILNYSENIFNQLAKRFEIVLYFITTEKIQKKYNIKNYIDKINFKKKVIILKNETENIINTLLNFELSIKDMKNNIIILHPDSSCKIDVNKLQSFLKKDYDGVLFGYNHFNPTDYLSADTGRFKVKNENVLRIFEKSKLSDNLYTCAGIHYFKNWDIFKTYAKKLQLRKRKYQITSEIYNLMISDKLNIKYFEVTKFISFSNISAINEFNFWNSYFKKKYKKSKKVININNIVPAAGSGKRHKQFKVAKPFMNITGKPMVSHAMEALPRAKNNYVILRDYVAKTYKREIQQIQSKFSEKINIVKIRKKTDGMARTCLFLEKFVDKNLPIIISSCDYKFLYDERKLNYLIKKKNPDSIIFTFRNYPDARINPNSYAYVKANKDKVIKVVEKKTISKKPNKDFAVTGAFYFKNWYLFKKAVDDMIKNKNTVNGEYYVATAIQELINKKNKVFNFEIDKFISWSLPIHLKTYLFWEKIFKF